MGVIQLRHQADALGDKLARKGERGFHPAGDIAGRAAGRYAAMTRRDVTSAVPPLAARLGKWIRG
jgi:hypothetical protein